MVGVLGGCLGVGDKARSLCVVCDVGVVGRTLLLLMERYSLVGVVERAMLALVGAHRRSRLGVVGRLLPRSFDGVVGRLFLQSLDGVVGLLLALSFDGVVGLALLCL